METNRLANAMLVMTGTVPHTRGHPYFRIDGGATAEQIKAINTALKTLLGTDDVDDPCRLMRLAGTVSYPPPDKIARGYVPELTTLHVRKDAPAYTVEQLLAAAGVTSKPEEPLGSPEYDAETISDARKGAYGQSALAEMVSRTRRRPGRLAQQRGRQVRLQGRTAGRRRLPERTRRLRPSRRRGAVLGRQVKGQGPWAKRNDRTRH